MKARPKLKSSGHGFTMIEVLVTLVIIAIGLLGLGGLQVFSLQNQLEAYQRAKAVMLATEMVNRIRGNARAAKAGEYTPGNSYGLLTPAVCDPLTQTTAEYDLCDWNNILAGQEVLTAGVNAGSINGAMGCIENVAGSTDGETRILVTVAWQGTAATVSPESDCGFEAFGAGDDDAFRRVASLEVVLADLEN